MRSTPRRFSSFARATMALFVLVAACSKGSPPSAKTVGAVTGGASASCSPAGTELKVVAKNITFDRDCLAAPPDQRFTIRLDNEDPTRHDIEIYGLTTDGPKTFFEGKPFPGPRAKTFEVDALPTGMYYFECTVHPTAMNGTFVVE